MISFHLNQRNGSPACFYSYTSNFDSTQQSASYCRAFALPHVPHEPTSMKTAYLWVSRLGPHEVGHEGVAAGRDFSLPSFKLRPCRRKCSLPS